MATQTGEAPPSPERAVSISMPQLLDAMEGVAYLTDGAGIILAAPEFYRRDGPEDVLVSDGVCPTCTRRVVLPNI